MMILSGVFFSKNNLPDWLLTATHFLPLTALNDGLRKIALEGLSIFDLTFEISVLLAYTVFCSFLAQRRFRWY
jgi:ABC-type multidrug transport system permease subunit